jgi:membrane-bound lytic murein transglycosylase B
MSLIRLISSKYIVFFISLLLLTFISPAQTVAEAETSGGYFNSLQERLIKDGFNKSTITEIYNKPQVNFETKGITNYLVHNEAKLNYDQFASAESIQKALEYIEKHKSALVRAERDYGVSKEVITAIILVETRLGTFLGRPSILNTLSTMASLADSDVRNTFWSKVSSSTRLTKKNYEKWAGKKSKWAYKELKAFLKYTAKEKMDPIGIYGSYAGAMGIAQFVPSNILAFAKDGNSDGHVDLFNHADAITSIANYLKHYGWHPGIGRKKAQKIIFLYNHSNYYVETILKISKLLKG